MLCGIVNTLCVLFFFSRSLHLCGHTGDICIRENFIREMKGSSRFRSLLLIRILLSSYNVDAEWFCEGGGNDGVDGGGTDRSTCVFGIIFEISMKIFCFQRSLKHYSFSSFPLRCCLWLNTYIMILNVPKHCLASHLLQRNSIKSLCRCVHTQFIYTTENSWWKCVFVCLFFFFLVLSSLCFRSFVAIAFYLLHFILSL